MTYFSFPSPINSQITDSVTQSIGSNYWTDYKTLMSTSLLPEQTVVFEGEKEDGYKIILAIPGAAKETVSVTYVTDENIVKVNAESKVEDYSRTYQGTYKLSRKYDLDAMECSLKNGLLIISIPYFKQSKPKEVKIS